MTVLEQLDARVLPHVALRRIVVNQSARAGDRITLLVVHDTESHNRPGDADLAAIGEWFDNPAAQASSHVCTDAEGRSARYVTDDRKAWHVAAFNSVSLGVEQIGFASDAGWPDAQLRETARWLAHWSRHHGVPLRKGRVIGGRVIRPGVVRHSDLGAAGGGHNDPGGGYPLHQVLGYARAYHAAALQGGPLPAEAP